MKIGLLGGSFNPPHLGHVHISNLAIKNLGLDQIWWMPTKQNPFKDPSVYEDYSARISQSLTLTQLNHRIYIKEFDDIYTVDLLSKLNRKYPNVTFFWIMGSDNLVNFHKWKNFKLLLNKVSLAIFSRETSLRHLKKTKSWGFIAKSNYKIFFSKNLDISSTEIRNNLISSAKTKNNIL